MDVNLSLAQLFGFDHKVCTKQLASWLPNTDSKRIQILLVSYPSWGPDGWGP